MNAFSGISSVYNHGNQPCLHIPWLFNFSGQPWLTQKWTRTICNEFYGTSGLHGYGYGQDEDQGQLGAWYVISALGLFDVLGGSRAQPTLQIGSPLFDRVTITLNQDYHTGERFVIETHNNGQDNPYIQHARLNGRELTRCWFDFQELTKGGTLALTPGQHTESSMGPRHASAVQLNPGRREMRRGVHYGAAARRGAGPCRSDQGSRVCSFVIQLSPHPGVRGGIDDLGPGQCVIGPV